MDVGKKLLIGLLLVFGLFTHSFSQSLPQSDNLEYTSGSDLTGSFSPGGAYWDDTALPGVNPVAVANFGLQYTGYLGSGVGLSARFGTERKGISFFFSSTAISGGALYYSFMIKVDSASQNGSPIVTATQSTSIAESRGLLYVMDGGVGGWKFGVRKATGGVASPVYTSGTYAKTDTHVVVVKYTFNTGGGTDDAVSLWVNPDLSGTELGADVQTTDASAPDATGFKYLYFLEQATAESTYYFLDGVRVGTSWSDAPLPIQLTQFLASANRMDVNLQWSTATETNNYGFEVERRTVAGDQGSMGAEGSWEKVGFVQGAGTSTSPRDYSFVDNVSAPGRYAYRIKQVDLSGAFTYYSSAEVEVGFAPKEFALGQNYPNPFNPSTKIEFSVPENGSAVLKVFNMLGQEVATLYEGNAEAGKIYQREFNASTLPTGVYVSRLEFAGQSVMRKMLFVK